jgi:hypothetical protein
MFKDHANALSKHYLVNASPYLLWSIMLIYADKNGLILLIQESDMYSRLKGE